MMEMMEIMEMRVGGESSIVCGGINVLHLHPPPHLKINPTIVTILIRILPPLPLLLLHLFLLLPPFPLRLPLRPNLPRMWPPLQPQWPLLPLKPQQPQLLWP